MDNQKKKCSSTEHEETLAISFCRRCEIYMCSKCVILHSKLLKNHQTFILDKDFDEIFTGFCTEEKHQMELEFFCKNHNQLCCAACISKIKKNDIGKHKDCEICIIEDIKEEKINKLKQNINTLEILSKKIEDSINEIKGFFEKINKNKEELKLEIQKLFTKIRNELNNREDQLLLEVDRKYDEIYFNEEIVKKSEKLPIKIKTSLEKGKKLDNLNKDDKLNLLINECINIENNIKDINAINDNLKKCSNFNNFKVNFLPNNEQEINKFIEIIKNLGRINYYTKIGNYQLKKSLQLNSGICSVIVLSNNDIACGKRNGELVIYDPINLKEISKVKAHSNGNTSIYSLLELSDKSILT